MAMVAFVAAASVANHASFAWEYETRAFLRQVDSVLEDSLPSITEVVPGYEAPSEPGPGLIVADLETNASDNRDWGKAIGQILRWDLMFSHRTPLRLPDFNHYYQDAGTLEMAIGEVGRSPRSVGLAAKRLGIDHALTGTITIKDEKFELELALRKMPQAEPVATYSFSGALAQLPEKLLGIPPLIYSALGLTAAEQSLPSAPAAQITPAELDKFSAALSGDPSGRGERMRQLWAQDITNPLLAAHYIQHMEVEKNLQAYFERIEQVRALYSNNAGIEFAVARSIRFRDSPSLLDIKIKRLKKIVANNPHDPMPMQVLSATLADGRHTLDALAVSREALRRFPDNYRVWWSMSYALMEYIWQLRGTSYWTDVSPKAQRLFPALKELAGRAVDKALSLNDQNSMVWVVKMYTIGQYDPAFMESFRTAIRLDSRNRNAYEMAINYTLPQWGGSFEEQDAVLTLAQKNVGDADWFEQMRKMYVSERPLGYRLKRWFKSLAHPMDEPFNAALAFFILLAIAVVVLRLRSD